MQSTARPNKNKATPPRLAGQSVAPVLAGVESSLELLTTCLAAYERSSHPDRIEALRWLEPRLENHLSALQTLRASVGGDGDAE